jgi:hypothetical protein
MFSPDRAWTHGLFGPRFEVFKAMRYLIALVGSGRIKESPNADLAIQATAARLVVVL